MLARPQVKFTSAVKLSEGGAVGPEYTRDEEENFFKRLGKWRSGRRNPSKLHHTEEKDGRPPPPRGAPQPPAHPRPIVPSSLFVRVVWCRVLDVLVLSPLPSLASTHHPCGSSLPAPLCQPECVVSSPSASYSLRPCFFFFS